MASSAFDLPQIDDVELKSRDDLVALVRDSAERSEPIYPIGGGTSLDFGLPAKRPGHVVRLSKLARILDYPARDMTITVEAGITMENLRQTLAAEGQELPLDVPQASQATLGGVLATNASGPRRYGHGTARDYVIGIRAVDGLGHEFAGGGRVVKNVAGYDFCKLLIGSMGTLAIITEVTLKVKPKANCRAMVGCPIDQAGAERLLACIPRSRTYPSIVAWLSGEPWQDFEQLAGSSDWIVVALEGSDGEVAWMTDCLIGEWRGEGFDNMIAWSNAEAARLFAAMVEFSSLRDCALTIKASVVPSGVASIVAAARQVAPDCSILAHAGNGIVIVRFPTIPAVGLAATLMRHLRPAAAAHQGHVVVWSGSSRDEWTRQLVWGGMDAPLSVMNQIKTEFDPHSILNPDRFVYS